MFMNKNQLKDLILNEPSKEEIEKLIKIEEQAGRYIKYCLYDEDKNSNDEYNTIVIDFGVYPNVIYAIQNGEIILQLELKDNENIAKNWFEKAKETYEKFNYKLID